MQKVRQAARVIWPLLLGAACGWTISGVLLGNTFLLYVAGGFILVTTLSMLALPDKKRANDA